jgi:hypothetical protein
MDLLNLTGATVPWDGAAVCFALPEPANDAAAAGPAWWATAPAGDGPDGLPAGVAAGLSRVLPALVCGEESAVNVFHREGRRLGAGAWRDVRRALAGIEAEERGHHAMLQWVRGRLPAAPDLAATAARTRWFFRRMQSRDVAVHFARIVELDSAVCRVMHAVGRSDRIAPRRTLRAVFRQIQREESRHVRVSRRRCHDLGLTPAAVAADRDRVRRELVALLAPTADAFDAIGVDPDRLFRSIRGHGIDALPHA